MEREMPIEIIIFRQTLVIFQFLNMTVQKLGRNNTIKKLKIQLERQKEKHEDTNTVDKRTNTKS